MNTRSEREERRYRSAINSGLDVKLARELRGRSDQYIYETYGIPTAKKIPKLKKLSKETKYKKQLEIRKYRYARERGIKPENIVNPKLKIDLRKASFNKIEERARYYTPKEPPKAVKIAKVESTRKQRIAKWGEWSKKENRESFPTVIKNQAQQINLKKGFDINAKYGFTVMFYAYIEKEPTKKWLDLIKADRVTESAIYKTSMKLA